MLRALLAMRLPQVRALAMRGPEVPVAEATWREVLAFSEAAGRPGGG